MTQLFGRFFQLVAMILLPVGLFIGVFRNNVRLEVNLLFIGAAFFVAGWFMARQRE
jgi:hypothetical protein